MAVQQIRLHTPAGLEPVAFLDDAAELQGTQVEGLPVLGKLDELVEVVREHPHRFAVGVAAHPEVHPRSVNREADRRHLAEKLALADFALTQFFFDPADYFRMVDELSRLGVTAPVVPGVFPVTAPKTARHFADNNGTAIPEDLFRRIEASAGDERTSLAVESATALCASLLEGGAPGIHLYTMNRAEVANRIVANLGDFR